VTIHNAILEALAACPTARDLVASVHHRALQNDGPGVALHVSLAAGVRKHALRLALEAVDGSLRESGNALDFLGRLELLDLTLDELGSSSLRTRGSCSRRQDRSVIWFRRTGATSRIGPSAS